MWWRLSRSREARMNLSWKQSHQTSPQSPKMPATRAVTIAALVLAIAAIFAAAARADRPYAPSRDYHLQNVRVSLRFDLDQRKVIGDVTQTLSPLREDRKSTRLNSSHSSISYAVFC